MSERDVRVFVADDHPLYRDEVARAISERPGLALVGVAGDGHAAMTAIRDLRPDVAVLDITMADLGGIEIAATILREKLPTRVLLLSASPGDVYAAVAAGATGYLMIGARTASVCVAVESIAGGGAVLASEAQTALVQRIRDRTMQVQAALSEREREVLGLTAEGLSAPQIGARLHLSPTTVKSHLHRAYGKLGVSDRAAAVAVAIRSGLLD